MVVTKVIWPFSQVGSIGGGKMITAGARLLTSLATEVAHALQPHGFTQVKGAANYARSFRLGHHQITLNVARFPEEIHVAVHVGVRIEALETRLLSIRDDVPAAIRSTVASFGCELGNLTRRKRHVWHVRSVATLQEAVPEMHDLVKRAALPYFDRFETLEHALALAADDGPDAWLISDAIHTRANAALGLAFLLHDRARFDALLVAKRAVVRARCDHVGTREFERVAGALVQGWDAT